MSDPYVGLVFVCCVNEMTHLNSGVVGLKLAGKTVTNDNVLRTLRRHESLYFHRQHCEAEMAYAVICWPRF